MIKVLGFLAFIADRLHRKVSDAAWDFERRRQDRAEAKRRAWLLTLDPDEVRKGGDLGSVILARQAEIAQVSPRKGGINRGPSKVVTRPAPPAPMGSNAQ